MTLAPPRTLGMGYGRVIGRCVVSWARCPCIRTWSEWREQIYSHACEQGWTRENRVKHGPCDRFDNA